MSTIILTVDSQEPDRLFASTVRAMRRGLDVTVAQLARASGIARRSIEDVEAGGAITRAERHHLAVALGALSRTVHQDSSPWWPEELTRISVGGPRT